MGNVVKAWSRVMADNDPLEWIICKYSADGKTLKLKCKGTGGLQAFKEKLGQLGTSIAWGGFRCYDVDKHVHVECKRPKLVFVQYTPDTTSHFQTVRQNSHKDDVKEALWGAHIDVAVEQKAENLDELSLVQKLQEAAGACNPTGYEFDEGCFIEAGTGICM